MNDLNAAQPRQASPRPLSTTAPAPCVPGAKPAPPLPPSNISAERDIRMLAIERGQFVERVLKPTSCVCLYILEGGKFGAVEWADDTLMPGCEEFDTRKVRQPVQPFDIKLDGQREFWLLSSPDFLVGNSRLALLTADREVMTVPLDNIRMVRLLNQPLPAQTT